MNPGPVIRAYEPRDRPALRHICCETADAGQPVESFFRDREFIADLVTRYYTDFEPGHAWVADLDGNVVGYLTGCFDTGRQRRVTGWRILPAALAGAVLRGTLVDRETWRMLGALARTFLDNGLPPATPLPRFPAHVHVNLLPAARGRDIGRQLMEQFLRQARAAGIGGVHASVRADNEAACRFFERMKFTELHRVPMVLPVGENQIQTAATVYARTL